MNDLIVTPELQHSILQSVEVRMIFPEERMTWNCQMLKHHYFGFHSLIGESLRYVANYLFILKDNQKNLKQDITNLTWLLFPLNTKQSSLKSRVLKLIKKSV